MIKKVGEYFEKYEEELRIKKPAKDIQKRDLIFSNRKMLGNSK